jgi:thiamine monophosphate synthase
LRDNRLLCKGDFLERIEEIARAGPYAVILREKDFAHDEYQTLAAQCKQITDKYRSSLIIHSDIAAALNLKISQIHLPLPYLIRYWDKIPLFTRF